MRAQEMLAGTVHDPADRLPRGPLVGGAGGRRGQAPGEGLAAAEEGADRLRRGREGVLRARRRRPSPPPRPRKARPGPVPRPEGGLWSSGHHRRHAPAFPAGISLLGSGGGQRRDRRRPPFASCHRRGRARAALLPQGSAGYQHTISTLSVFLQFHFYPRYLYSTGNHVQDAVRAAVHHVRPEPGRRKRIRRGGMPGRPADSEIEAVRCWQLAWTIPLVLTRGPGRANHPGSGSS